MHSDALGSGDGEDESRSDVFAIVRIAGNAAAAAAALCSSTGRDEDCVSYSSSQRSRGQGHETGCR